MAVALTMGLSFGVQAADTCQVTLTSPTIVKTGCEKVGSVTFSFDAGTQLAGSDWWYMDLPAGATICSPLDYFVFNPVGPLNIQTAGANVNFTNVGDGLLGGASVAAGTSSGPITVSNLSAGTGGNLVITGEMTIQVTAAQGSQRVWLRVHDNAAGGGEFITVGAETTLDVKILDGGTHAAGTARIVRDSDGDGDYGEDLVAGDDLLAGPVPDIFNTLCVNSVQMSGSLMFVSFASLNDFITFSGDSQIAHASAAQPLALALCKGETTGDIEIGAQGSCDFDFETPLNYCDALVPGSFQAQGGNMIFLESTTTFGDPGDSYDLRIYSDTSGVYFAGGAVVQGFIPDDDKCTATGNAVIGAGAFILYNAAGTANATAPNNSCSVPADNRVDELRTLNGAITLIDTYDALWINLPNLVYDTSLIGAGTEADIRFSLRKYPCGEIFTATHMIGTFVTTCPVGAAGTNLLFPFFPPMDGSIPGWWGGFMIVNGSTAAGTAALTFTEADGDVATYTTPSIAAAGQWNAGAFADLLTQVTPDGGNSGTFGDANFVVQATCTFNLGAGFAFTGNGTEGTGYTAYSTDW